MIDIINRDSVAEVLGNLDDAWLTKMVIDTKNAVKVVVGVRLGSGERVLVEDVVDHTQTNRLASLFHWNQKACFWNARKEVNTVLRAACLVESRLEDVLDGSFYYSLIRVLDIVHGTPELVEDRRVCRRRSFVDNGGGIRHGQAW